MEASDRNGEKVEGRVATKIAEWYGRNFGMKSDFEIFMGWLDCGGETGLNIMVEWDV